jgi:uroporphyrinogen-III synthase
MKVLVTRAREDAAPLAHSLALAGYEPVQVPLIERRWLPLAVAEAAQLHADADWVLVTSATAADVLAAGAPSAWRTARFAAVGPVTAKRLTELGYPAQLVPEKATAHDLVLAVGDLSGQVVVHPRGDLAPPAVIEGLKLAGATVIDVIAYENAAPAGCADRLRAALPVAATTLLSSSAATRVAEAIGSDRFGQLGKVIVIGPSTERSARELGLPVDAVADPHTVSGVVAAVRNVLG